MKETILNFAPTGMIPTKKDTPYIPIEPREIIDDIKTLNREQAITIVHVHARDKLGKPTNDIDIWKEIIYGIREINPDIVLCVSTSGRTINTYEYRSLPLTLTNDYKPDMASLTLSSLNFVTQSSENSPKMVQDLAQTMLDNGIKPELECFDAGMINYAKYLIKKNIIKPPYYMNIILGNIAGAQPKHAQALLNDIPESCYWAFGGIGDHQLPSNLLAIALDGGVRIGLEDNIRIDHRLCTNYELVHRLGVIIAAAGKSIMSPIELRSKLEI